MALSEQSIAELTRVINERGYIVVSAREPLAIGKIIGGGDWTDHGGLAAEYPLFVVEETDPADWVAHILVKEGKMPHGTYGPYFYRCRLD